MTPTLAPPDAPPAVDRGDAIDAGVVCPRCGRRSLDESFCEHCQFELPLPSAGSSGSAAGLVSGASWSLASLGVSWPDDPSASFDVASGPTALRVRAIRPELWPEVIDDVRARQAVSLKALPPVHVLETAGGALVLAEAWQSEAAAASSALPASVNELLVETLRWCRWLDAALTELHDSGHVWLEFDPCAVEVKGDQLRITNLDWRLFPHGRCASRLARISPRYSPPEVCQFRDEFIGPRTDVFHLALSAYYRLAGLRNDGFAGRGLESFGFEIPSLRVFRPDLPVGIWPVLRRALSINANNRHASTGELMDELERAVARREPKHHENDFKTVATFARTWDDPCDPHVLANVATASDERVETASPDSEPSLWQRVVRRLTGEAVLAASGLSANHLTASNTTSQPAVPEVGWQTVAGRAKSALGAVNQDCAVVLREPVRDREVLLMIVADGVTHARVGAGERASGLACEVLVASIREQLRACSADAEPEWPSLLDRACQSASAAIVTDALSILDRPAQISDNDLMSTTALIGVLDGSDLYLANVGDSRAYLVASGLAEQLTVDGDVASSQLAAGTPPEQVQELGTAGKALRFCLGACRENDAGQLVAELERARPQIGHWRIEPGDTFVLCSDGLVEERVFLEPEDLVRIVETPSHDCASPGGGRVGQARFERRPTNTSAGDSGGPALEASWSHPTECSRDDSKVLLRGTTTQELAEQLVSAADAKQRLPSATEPNGYGDNITCIVLRLVEGPPPPDASSRKG